MRTEVLDFGTPNCEVIVGQANFTVWTVEALYNALLSSAPGIRFGVAMNEAKPRLVRVEGNDEELKGKAAEMALRIGAGHVFVVCMRDAFPIHVLNAIKGVPTVATVYLATSNPFQVIVAETELGRAVLGVVDGKSMERVEGEEERGERKELVRKLGYL